MNVTSDGRPHLGSPIGTPGYVQKFIADKVDNWVSEVDVLSSIAISQPHAAYTCFTHGLVSRWLYVIRTVPDTSYFQRLEKALLTKFIPALTGLDPPGTLQRSLFALPTRFGGLGIVAPDSLPSVEFSASLYVTAPLRSLILSQDFNYSADIRCSQFSRKLEIKQSKTTNLSTLSKELLSKLTLRLQRAVSLAQEKGASSWLTALPIQEHGFSLHKTAFHDALALRYGWLPSRTPSHCACGSSFSVDHALSCPKGGFPSIRHNEVRDLTADLLSEVCHDVEVEPNLQPLNDETFQYKTSNTQDGARLDISMNGFWGGRYEKCYTDIRVFNPLAPSNNGSSIQSCYRKHESVKKRAYESRIREVEHSTFTPLVFSATGGMGHEATIFYKRLASLLSEKWKETYASVLGWIRCRLSFCLLRSAVQCIRGARSSQGHYIKSAPVDLIQSETQFVL